MMRLRRFHSISIILLALSVASCGGGGGAGGDDRYAPATSPSFLPLRASAANGAPAATFWRYTANDGQPFEVTADAGTLHARINEYLVTRTPEDSLLRSSTRGTVSGTIRGISVSGSIQGSEAQELVFGDTTRIAANTSSSQSSLSGAGTSTTVRLNLETRYSPSYLYFLDSPDLGTLPIGHTSQEEVQATFRASGNRTINGQSEPLRFNDLTASGPVTWRITTKLDRATVQGREYRDLVVVDHETWRANSALTALERTSITYWVAKGVGVVHVENILNTGAREPLLGELLETNLVAPGA